MKLTTVAGYSGRKGQSTQPQPPNSYITLVVLHKCYTLMVPNPTVIQSSSQYLIFTRSHIRRILTVSHLMAFACSCIQSSDNCSQYGFACLRFQRWSDPRLLLTSSQVLSVNHQGLSPLKVMLALQRRPVFLRGQACQTQLAAS